MTDPWCWYIYANMAPINILPVCYYIYQHHGSYGIPANWRVCYGKRMKIWSCKNGSWIYLLKMIHFPRRPSGQMASTMRRGSHCKRTRVTRQSPGIFCGSTSFEAMLGPRFLLIFSMNMSSALILGYLGLTELPISWEFTSGKRGWSFVMTACDGMISSTKIKGSTKQIIRKASENKELIQWATQLEIQQVKLGVGFFERWKTSNLVGMWNIQQVGFVLSSWHVSHTYIILHYHHEKEDQLPISFFGFGDQLNGSGLLICWFVAGVSWFVPIQESKSVVPWYQWFNLIISNDT